MKTDATALSLYDCQEIVEQIELAAQLNDGETSEEDIKRLVEAQTQSIVKLEKLCGAIAFYENGIEFCKKQEERIKEARQRASKKVESIKKYLLPFAQSKGKPFTAGTFTISTRKSKQVIVDGDVPAMYCRVIPATVEPDKAKIKADLELGVEIKNCQLQNNVNLSIK